MRRRSQTFIAGMARALVHATSSAAEHRKVSDWRNLNSFSARRSRHRRADDFAPHLADEAWCRSEVHQARARRALDEPERLEGFEVRTVEMIDSRPVQRAQVVGGRARSFAEERRPRGGAVMRPARRSCSTAVPRRALVCVVLIARLFVVVVVLGVVEVGVATRPCALVLVHEVHRERRSRSPRMRAARPPRRRGGPRRRPRAVSQNLEPVEVVGREHDRLPAAPSSTMSSTSHCGAVEAAGGSSKSSTSGFMTRTDAIATRFFCPPDSWYGARSASSRCRASRPCVDAR